MYVFQGLSVRMLPAIPFIPRIIGSLEEVYFKGNERNKWEGGGVNKRVTGKQSKTYINIFMLLCYIFFTHFLNNIFEKNINQKLNFV